MSETVAAGVLQLSLLAAGLCLVFVALATAVFALAARPPRSARK